MSTQYTEAIAGNITPEMEFVAKRELLTPELIRDEVAAGRMVIPANKVLLNAKSMRILAIRPSPATLKRNWKSCTFRSIMVPIP